METSKFFLSLAKKTFKSKSKISHIDGKGTKKFLLFHIRLWDLYIFYILFFLLQDVVKTFLLTVWILILKHIQFANIQILWNDNVFQTSIICTIVLDMQHSLNTSKIWCLKGIKTLCKANYNTMWSQSALIHSSEGWKWAEMGAKNMLNW